MTKQTLIPTDTAVGISVCFVTGYLVSLLRPALNDDELAGLTVYTMAGNVEPDIAGGSSA